MAKQSIKETVTKVHKLEAEGILVNENGVFVIKTDDFGDTPIQQLLEKFNGETLKITIATKEVEE